MNFNWAFTRESNLIHVHYQTHVLYADYMYCILYDVLIVFRLMVHPVVTRSH